MGPDELVVLEESAPVDTENNSGTVALAETLVLTAFFPLVCFLTLGAEEHLLAM